MKSPPQQFTDGEDARADDAASSMATTPSAGRRAVTTTFFLVRHAAHDRVGRVLCRPNAGRVTSAQRAEQAPGLAGD